jgi:signal peptidase I
MNAEALRCRARHFWVKEIRPLVILAVVLFAIRSSLADWNDVPTGSMKPTIVEGDRVYVNKLAYDLKVPFTTWHIAEWSNPKRGDIVVFYSPYNGQRLVKRVVGLPGDTVEMRNETLILNGQTVQYGPISDDLLNGLNQDDRISHTFATEHLPGQAHSVAAWPAVRAMRDFAPQTVPAGKYFMMGDNRDDSFDSRYWGTVERKRIVGKATAVVLSFDKQHYWKPRLQRSFTSLQQ